MVVLRRLLRIDYASNVGDAGDKKPGASGGGGGGGAGGGQRGGTMNTHEIIMGVVSTMPIEKMYEILGQLKTICTQNREQARELFATHPHLALAVMRMQVTHPVSSRYIIARIKAHLRRFLASPSQ